MRELQRGSCVVSSSIIATPSQEKKILGIRVTTCELDFWTASELLPNVLAMAAPLVGMMADRSVFDDESMLEAVLSRAALAMAGGKLIGVLPDLLQTTDVYLPTGERGQIERIDLSSRDQINKAFTGRKQLAVGVIQWTLEVNFKDFLSAAALLAPLIKTTGKGKDSPTSSQSTSEGTSATA